MGHLLIATDAAREGINLQAHCWNLFHFDLPWNPSRLEQRNGRIDRKLQPNAEVFCHYFFYEQRPEDRVLRALVRKTDTIRLELGSLSEVIEKRLHTGIRRAEAEQAAKEIEGIEENPEKKAAREEEFEEAAKDRQAKLRSEVETLKNRIADARKWIGLDEEQLRDALCCSIEMLGADPLKPIVTPPNEPTRYVFPNLQARHGGDPRWTATLDTLREPPQDGKLTYQWRRESPLRPVIFQPPPGFADDVVQLHLSHRIVQRLLSRFLAQGFIYQDLSRACLAQTEDAIPRAVLLGRLAIYGKGAARLHEQLITVTARWVDPADRKGALSPYGRDAEAKTMALLEEALKPESRRAVPEKIAKRLQAVVAQDIQDHRFGAWAQLLALFRLIHSGSKHPELKMPARRGHLFDPDRFPFLEGRASAQDPLAALPLISDGVIHRVLHNLLILLGERLSYRTLDVEEIGSVYQTIMGFSVEVATGTAVALKGKRKNGGVPAAPVITLEELVAVAEKDRNKWLKEHANHELTGEAEETLETADSIDDLLAALDKKLDRNATPAPVTKGGLVLQPTDERRRSGSHYTPRSFTEPIVRKTIEPILKRFGDKPTPEQILDLKICDIAIGSGAFQVETGRQLATALVKAWQVHGGRPPVPPDETEELLAMRLIAQRCLYGVDRNPMAVDLAKLSLWLATLAKDHPFTFLDHAFRCGDSLVGLTRQQIAEFHWKHVPQRVLGQDHIEKRINAATKVRKEIIEGGDTLAPELKRQKLEAADEALDLVRFAGDLVIAAFFNGDKDKQREANRHIYIDRLATYLTKFDMSHRPTDIVKALRSGQFPVTPFHWEIEFPEVFLRDNPGFDAFVGNPPFAGKNTLGAGNREGYLDWLKTLHEDSHGNADLVAHFFRRVFSLLRKDGCFGLLATNTIGQGDTRATGLRWICTHGGTIYAARKRYKWPGQAAVVVSVVHATKANPPGLFDLDGRSVPVITAYLFHAGGHEDPAVLLENEAKSFQGPIPLGMGFTFDDTTSVATPISEMQRLIDKDPRNAERIFPYLGADDFLESPTQAHSRYIIYFGEMTEEEARRWSDLMAIVEQKVRPIRERDNRETRRRYWWRFVIQCFRKWYQVSRLNQHPSIVEIDPQPARGTPVVVGAGHQTAESGIPDFGSILSRRFFLRRTGRAAATGDRAFQFLFIQPDLAFAFDNPHDLLPVPGKVTVDERLTEGFPLHGIEQRGIEVVIKEGVGDDSGHKTKAAGSAHGGVGLFLTGMGLMVPEFVAAQVEEGIDGRRLILHCADDIKIPTEHLQQLRRERDPVIRQTPALSDVEHREQ